MITHQLVCLHSHRQNRKKKNSIHPASDSCILFMLEPSYVATEHRTTDHRTTELEAHIIIEVMHAIRMYTHARA